MTHKNKLDIDREWRRQRCYWKLFREVEAELETAYVAEAQRLESLSDDQFEREMRAKGWGRSEVRSYEVRVAEAQRLELEYARDTADPREESSVAEQIAVSIRTEMRSRHRGGIRHAPSPAR